jgi:hypothetical protein
MAGCLTLAPWNIKGRAELRQMRKIKWRKRIGEGDEANI